MKDKRTIKIYPFFVKVFEDSQDTFFKKFLEWVWATPTYQKLTDKSKFENRRLLYDKSPNRPSFTDSDFCLLRFFYSFFHFPQVF